MSHSPDATSAREAVADSLEVHARYCAEEMEMPNAANCMRLAAKLLRQSSPPETRRTGLSEQLLEASQNTDYSWISGLLAKASWRIAALESAASAIAAPKLDETFFWPIGFINNDGGVTWEPGREPGEHTPGKLVYIVREPK